MKAVEKLIKGKEIELEELEGEQTRLKCRRLVGCDHLW
jgi:hypothetical protein